MARSGPLRHKLRFERKGEGVDDYGNVKTDFAFLFDTRGNVREQVGKEVLAGGSVESTRNATIRVRAGSLSAHSVTEADRIIARGATWNIRSIASADDKGRMLDLLCETGVAD